MSEPRLSGKRVLVTGAAGFIGFRLVVRLLEQGVTVVACVNPGQEARMASVAGARDLAVVPCSLADAQAVVSWKDILASADLVAHLWVNVPAGRDFVNTAAEDVATNLLGTMNLLGALQPRTRGICFSSSVQVYGRPTQLPVREESIADPLSSYACTKLAIETYLRAYSREQGVPVTILRYSTVYGPGEKSHRAIPNFLWALAEGEALTIYGEGSEIKDYVYVDDVVAGTLMALETNRGGVFNIASGEGCTALDVARAVTQLCGASVQFRFAARTTPSSDIVCDISAATAAFGYKPLTLMSQGLALEIEWFEREVLGRPLAATSEKGALR